MQVTVGIMASTAEASASLEQAIAPFGMACSAIGRRYPAFSTIDRLVISLTLDHPLSGSGRSSGSFHAKEKTFYASAPVDYAAWVGLDWARRVDAVAAAIQIAIRSVHKTRITMDERELLANLFGEIATRLKDYPPPVLVPLGSVWLRYGEEESQEPTVSFFPPTDDQTEGGRTVEVKPEQAFDIVAELGNRSRSPPTGFKLYRRVEGGLEYHEAWPAPSSVVEHRGLCGDRGQSREHTAPTEDDQVALLARLKAELGKEGFRSIPMSRHAQVIVESAIEGFGTSADIALRHRLEDFLSETVGWLGLGHCDGGSSGSGSMEVVCMVVDAAIAVAAINQELAGSAFARFRARPVSF